VHLSSNLSGNKTTPEKQKAATRTKQTEARKVTKSNFSWSVMPADNLWILKVVLLPGIPHPNKESLLSNLDT
jgi:hypothetical protein